MKKFFEQLKRRKVLKVALAYVVVAWLLLQVVDVIFPAMGLPPWTITLVLALLAVGFPLAVVLAWVFDVTPGGIEKTPSDKPDQTAVADNDNALPDDKSIAVLPFLDLSAERDQEHFCDGLTEELLNVLTGIAGLRIASRTSCFAFKGKDVDLQAAAGKLRVAYVLEGSVRKAGERIRVTGQLIEAASDSHLWSETYDRELDDIFAIQDDIAARILGVLKLRFRERTEDEATTSDPRAWELFLRGRGYAMTRISQDHPRAASLFRRAVKRDPGFVRAWIELAGVSANEAVYHGGGEEARDVAVNAAKKAMELAPARSDTRMASGFAHLAQHDYIAAEQDFLKAAEMNPREKLAWHHAGRVALLRADHHNARIYFKRATDEDPDDWESPLLAVQNFQAQGDMEGARRMSEIGLERARIYLATYPDNPRPWYLGSSALSFLGQLVEGRKWVERALELSPEDQATRYNSACFYAIIGEHEKAFDLLENSLLSRSWIENDSELDSLRDHPRYQEILDTIPD